MRFFLFIYFFCAAPSAPSSCSLGKKLSPELRKKLLQNFQKCESDIQLDQDSLTGFTLTDSSSLRKIIRNKSEFFSSREQLCAARTARLSYIKHNAEKLKKLQEQIQEIVEAHPNDENKKKEAIEELARHSVHKRNADRMSRYDTEAKKRKLRERNFEKYKNEEGPTPEYLFAKYGSWEEVILASARPQRCLSFALGILPSEQELASIFNADASKEEL